MIDYRLKAAVEILGDHVVVLEDGRIRVGLDGANDVYATPEQLDLCAQRQAELEAIGEPPKPKHPQLTALADLHLENFEVTGFETLPGVTAAFVVDVGKVWIFFNVPKDAYSINVSSSEGRANWTMKTPEMIEITLKDDVGVPVEVADFSLQIYEVI